MRRLAYLYKKKGDYKKAIETFKKVKEFKEKRGSKLWIKEFEFQINELQRLLDKEWK
jgi:tetratricopeptide (TPR) repeat protein